MPNWVHISIHTTSVHQESIHLAIDWKCNGKNVEMNKIELIHSATYQHGFIYDYAKPSTTKKRQVFNIITLYISSSIVDVPSTRHFWLVTGACFSYHANEITCTCGDPHLRLLDTSHWNYPNWILHSAWV